ncbi:phosphotransferase [Oceanobacillus halophilus]|uniref:Aminoglycoside phosphotransferase domain-containing protein n=1 Tax=Oceanobacillus halophilus TaxID=930130 RepID=A0A495A7G2_9BACI|nr:phosphotransferase [Oceanobacillus halophilus]RKQ34294.1 hypothetical protein D8M06_07900 [Oceanobacillus halophilus]
MGSDLLTLAKEAQKKHQWKKSIEYFEQYLHIQKDSSNETVYASYARSLRISGRTAAAKKVLDEGKNQHAQSERILLEYHNLYDLLGDWEAAKNVAISLIKLNPTHADYHFRLGRSYSFLKKYNKAKKTYQIALKHKHGLSFEQLTEQIQKRFAENAQEVRSNYVYIDGKNNLGAFIHEYKGRKFFTKISKYTNKNNGAGREENFYKDMCTSFSQLRNVVPEYIDSLVIDKISYITVEMIDSIDTNSIAKEDYLINVIKASQQITSISYEQLDNYPLPNYVFQFRKGRAISVVHFFTQIHKEGYNQKLFQAVKAIMKQHRYPKAVHQLIERLETVIMDNELYTFINPEKHYSLLHGDFAFQNVLIKRENRNPSVIDWTSHTIGPHFIDIARYFTSILLPYSEVKHLYLENDTNNKNLTMIEKIFFLYALVLFYFQKLGRQGLETELSDFILPAVEDVEKLVLSFAQSKEGDQMIKDSELQLKVKELEIKQLKQKVTILEQERKHLHKRLNDTLNSKSWQLTAPLRIFTENRKKR